MLWVLLFPLLGVLTCGGMSLIGQYRRLAWSPVLLSLGGCVFSFLSLVVVFKLAIPFLIGASLPPLRETVSFAWIETYDLLVTWGFVLDRLSAGFLVLIAGIGFLVSLYSAGYMQKDPGVLRYFALLNLFIFFMMVLVLADSLLLVLVGWEGVGLCSYLLIAFWFGDLSKAAAGKKAFIVNRVGDLGFFLVLFVLYACLMPVFDDNTALSSLAIFKFSYLLENRGLLIPVAGVLSFGLLWAACGKSAQIPLFVWLPDAMAGPTPVSALIHSATMVTAGLYLVARLQFIFVMSPLVMSVMLGIGLLTAFLGALAALCQYDIKKILAYSTISQLGLMFAAMGAQGFSESIAYVGVHAFFKASLFLGAGSVIVALHHEQDIRKMGGLFSKMPWTGGLFLLSILSLAAIPGTSGFFGKEEMLLVVISRVGFSVWMGLFLTVSALTAFYAARLFVFVFLGKTRFDKPESIHEPSWLFRLPLVLLGVCVLSGSFFAHPHSQDIPDRFFWTMVSCGVSVLSFGLSFWLYKRNLYFAQDIKKRLPHLYRFVCSAWGFDKVYDIVFCKGLKKVCESAVDQFVEKTVVEGVLVKGVSKATKQLGFVLGALNTGQIQYAIMAAGLGLLGMLCWILSNKIF